VAVSDVFRFRRKNFRLLTILKNINDRIGRGASPPPPSVIEPGRGVGSLPVWNTTSSAGCGTQNSRRRLQHDDCDDGDDGLTQSETTKVTADDVHVVARSCESTIIIGWRSAVQFLFSVFLF